jgi:hypothetical protein
MTNQMQQIEQRAVAGRIGTEIAQQLLRDGIRESKNDRLLRETVRLLPIINRVRAKMGTGEDL